MKKRTSSSKPQRLVGGKWRDMDTAIEAVVKKSRRVGKAPELGMGYAGETHGRMEGKPRANAQDMPRTVKPYRPHENYIVKETRYIHGENFYIPDDEMEQLLAGAVGRARRRREMKLCQHPSWTVWQRFEDMDQRSCLTCGKMEYK